MIPRSLRLSRREFESVRNLARAQSPHFSLSFGPSEKGGCGVVVAKKIEKSAVKRHLLKRRLRAVLSEFCDANRTLIVYAKDGSSTLPFPVLKDELTGLLERSRATSDTLSA